jgi:hemerythrin-like domain-containing protein
VGNDQPVETEDVQAVVQFLHTFADDHHQAKEESALFPELRRTSAAQEGPPRQMLFEHDQERSLVDGQEEALLTKRGTEFVHFANRITALLRHHIQKEDNILFDIVERSLSTEQDDKIVAEFKNFQTNMEFLADLRRLEWKYLRRAA